MLELLSYIVAAAGTILDEVSTRIALQRPGIYETNQFTVRLMAMGLWIPFDALVLTAAIGIPAFTIRRLSFAGRKGLLAFPLIYGFVRLAFGVWNLHWLW